MAAEPRVTARDPVKVVGGERWRRERERKRVRGFYFKSPRTPKALPFWLHPTTKINHFHQRKSSDHSVLFLLQSKLTYAVVFMC